MLRANSLDVLVELQYEEDKISLTKPFVYSKEASNSLVNPISLRTAKTPQNFECSGVNPYLLDQRSFS